VSGPDDDAVAPPSHDWRLLRRLLGYLKPHRAAVGAAFALIVALAGIDLVGPYLTKVAIDRHIARGDAAGLAGVAFLYLLALAAAFAVRFGQNYVMQMTGQRVMQEMRREIFAHLQRLHVGYFDRNPVGRLMTRVTTDVDAVNELFTSGVVSVFGDLFTLVGIMAVMLALDWRLALVSFTVIPLFFALTNWFRKGARQSFRETRRWVARINAFLQENLAGMSVVQLFRREERNREAFAAINRKHYDANMQAIFYYAVFYPVIELLAALATALILVYGGARVLEGGLTLGVLVAFIQYSERFWRPISDLSEKFNVLQAAMAASERIFGLLDTPTLVASPEGAARPASVQGRVSFEGVWFSYGGEARGPAAAAREPLEEEGWILKDVDFAVEPGRSVALVGATGAGKTSIISLLTRFYDVQRGRVALDGVDVRDWEVQRLRSSMALVLQDVHLFGGTIASNIRLGSDIPMERLRAAAEAVHAHRFVERLPKGYDTEVRERGATLSVGQKQLLSFARALAHDPRVLILDEATSSVDTETERLIQDALRVLLRGRTAIVIAHRLSTVQNVDEILVLHRGRIRERGTHRELLAHRGMYWKLYELQYKDQELRAPGAAAGATEATA
jgi:ATP-binding cassette, subfamily B, multidrug efflux pump